MFHVEHHLKKEDKLENFDIAIIGGGHAGTEATWIASQFGLKVLLLTSPDSGIASAPCNPAIGGVGKGQVVRELDALGGLMGRLADMSGIQFRILNESKGYAVQSTRAQIDKDLYSINAEEVLSKVANLNIVRDMVLGIEKENDSFVIKTKKSGVFQSKKLIVTTGTFLNGKLHTGEEQVAGGRVGCEKSVALSELLSMVKVLPKRFKTGTPPRLNIATIDFTKMEEQASDPAARNFHLMNTYSNREVRQISCYLTKTNSDTLGVIRQNKERSPIFNGQIAGVGPRYCPSIEDKAFRYQEKDVHHVFVEPEGLESNSVYPNGCSTSLPKDVQETFIRSIEGLENAEILVHGYAVEYDVVDTSELSLTFEYKNVPGLYFAGQVNGTSGYEEAAGQGFIAGSNAALSFLGKEPLVLDRRESYIGVMVEDLVSNLRDEPYRLFTARSENRLYIREDNTALRMLPYRRQFGLNSDLDLFLEDFLEQYDLLFQIIEERYFYKTSDEDRNYFIERGYGPLESNITLKELIKRPDLDPVKVLEFETTTKGLRFNFDVIRTVAIGSKYEGYINRASLENERLLKLERKRVNWEKILDSNNVSFECKLRIKAIRPETFGQLSRIEGIRPATLAYVAGNLV